MEENEQDTLNTSTFSKSSWDGDENINKIIDVDALVEGKEIVEGKHGQKYILTDTKTQQKYFAKSLDPTYNAEQQKNQKLETACCSAMLSCFSHTPYPVGIKKINNKDFIVFRYDEEDNTKQETNQQIHQYLEDINSTLLNNWAKQNEYINFFTSKFQSLPAYGKYYFIQLITHICFFGLKDRVSNNMLFEKNGMHHIDTDHDNKFMFDTTSINDLKALYAYYIQILANVNDNNIIQQCQQYLNKTINKINNIDYRKFADRFIRNCMALGVKEEDAYNYYNTFIKNMLTYVLNTITCIYNTINKHCNDRNQNWHTFFNSLFQGLQQMKSNILQNNNAIKISQKDWENKYQSKYNELNKNQPNTSNDDICNSCADKCLSIFRNCCWL